MGEVTITSSAQIAESVGGNWNWQNFITVSGDNVTIDGVNLLANSNAYYYDTADCNKAIELIDNAKNFTLKNSVIKARENDSGKFSGSVYINVAQPDNICIDTVTLSAWISGSAVTNEGKVTIRNVEQDYRGNSAAVYEGYGPGLTGNENAYTIDGLTIYADAKSCEQFGIDQVLSADMKSGTTYVLEAGTYNVESPLTIDKSVKVVGAVDADGKPATTLKGDNDSTSHGIVITGSADVTLENLEITEFGGAKQNNSAIKAGDDNSPYGGKLTVDNCIVSEFGKGGIVVKGGEADIKNTTVDVTNVNNVDNRAPNGIQIDQGAKAAITDCTVIDSSSSAEEWSATGVLVLRGAQITTISGNTFEHCDVAVTASTIYDSDSDLSGRTTSLPKDAINNNTFDNCDTKVLREVPVLAGQENANANGAALLDTLANAADGDYIAIAVLDNKGEISINLSNEAVIPADSTLSVDKNVTLTGNITNNGTMTNEGTITGTLTNNGSITNFGTLPEGVTGDVTAGVLVDSEEALLAAIAANDGKVITLDGSITLTKKLTINTDVTIDGNGYTISGQNDSRDVYIEVTDGTFDLSNVTLKDFGGNAPTYSGVGVIKVPTDAAATTKVITNNVNLENFCRSAYDIRSGSFEINGGTIDCGNSVSGTENTRLTKAILAGLGTNKVTGKVSNVTITNSASNYTEWDSSAIEVFSNADVTITGCKITNVQNGILADTCWGNGDVTVTVSDTTVDAKDNALYINNAEGDTEKATMNVASGTYAGTIVVNGADGSTGNSANGQITINGGKFDVDSGAKDYLASGAVIDGNGNVTVPSSGGSSSSGYQVSVDKATNGKVTVNTSRADKGDTVTITVTPDKGYELDKLTVTDKNGDTIKLTDKGNGKYTFTMPGGKVTVKAVFVEKSTELPFVDVAKNAYYYDAVAWAVENGVTNGTSATTFGPDLAVTRAQMVTFLWRAHGSPKATGTNPFTDVSTSDYYYDAVLWAVANGVTNGTSATTFSPDMAVTRAQAVTFQWRTAGSTVVTGSSFDDVAADAYYADAVTWAVANDITNGTSSNTFSPDAIVSRAQAVTFLYRELV